MQALTTKLSQYAAYHRDRRNIATHVVGIPLIVVALFALLGRPSFTVAGIPFSVGSALWLASSLYYLKLDLRFGMAMFALHGLALWIGLHIALEPQSVWLFWGLGLFLTGWTFQFIGHFWEGRKPAFVDDIMGLIIGPLFVVAELAFALGMRTDVRHQIEATVGPIRQRPPIV